MKSYEATGQCFPYCFKWAIANNIEAKGKDVIVHGFVTHPKIGNKYWHGWIEWNGRVYDWQTEQAKKQPMRISKFYALYKPENMMRYTPTEVIQKCVSTRHHGPWHPYGESLDEAEQVAVDFNKINLQKEYDDINRKAFDGKLPKIPLRWKNSIRTGGTVRATHNKITDVIKIEELTLSRFFRLSRDQFLGLLAHEMIHVEKFAQGIAHEFGGVHGPLFKKRVDEVSKILGIFIPVSESSDDMGIADPKSIKPIEALVLQWVDKSHPDVYLFAVDKSITKNMDKIKDYLVLFQRGEIQITVYRLTHPDTIYYTLARNPIDKDGILKRYRMSDKVWKLLDKAQVVFKDRMTVESAIDKLLHGTRTEATVDVDSALTEMSFTPKDVPRNYRMGFRLHYGDAAKEASSVAKQLGDMELKGVRGISGDPTISIRFFGQGNNAMLIMNGQELVKANKISRVLYDNPHFLMQDNMAALARLLSDSEENRTHTVSQIFSYLFGSTRKDQSLKFKDIQYRLSGTGYDLEQVWRKNPPVIDNVFQITKWLKNTGIPALLKGAPYDKGLQMLDAFPEKDLATEVIKTVQSLGEIYRDEGEWLLKDQTLRIPPKSRLFIMRKVPTMPEDWGKQIFDDEQKIKDAWRIVNRQAFEKYDAIQKEIDKYGLEDKYTIVDVASEDWTKVQDAFFTKYQHGRRPVRVEAFDPINERKGDWLYHTTSVGALEDILRTKKLIPKRSDLGAFISFAESPFFGDISGNDVVLVFGKQKLKRWVMQVEYDSQWFDRHRDQASYIAGEGWREQFNVEDYVEPDEEGEIDPDAEEQAWEDGELNAFEVKSDEKEWITKREGDEIPLKDGGLARIIVRDVADAAKISKEFAQSGLEIDVPIVPMSGPLAVKESLDERETDIEFLKFADKVADKLEKRLEQIQQRGTFYVNFKENRQGWYIADVREMVGNNVLPRPLLIAFAPSKDLGSSELGAGVTIGGGYGHVGGFPVIVLSGVSLSALESVISSVFHAARNVFTHELTHYWDETLGRPLIAKAAHADADTDEAWKIYLRKDTERNAFLREILGHYFDIAAKALKPRGHKSNSHVFQGLFGRNAKEFYDTVRHGFYERNLADLEKHLKPQQWRTLQKRIVEFYADLVRYVDGELPESVHTDSSVLMEGSFGPKDIPRNYRVAFSILKYDEGKQVPDERVCKQLENMKLEGVRGISDDPTISIQFFGVARDAMLVMNGPEVVKANNLTRIMYDNPHYLMQDNMTALARIFSSEGMLDRKHALNNLLEYFFGVLDKSDKAVAKFEYNLGKYSAGWSHLSDYPWKNHPRKINSIYDLTKWLKEVGCPEVAKEYEKSEWHKDMAPVWREFGELPASVFNAYLLKALKRIGEVYKNEGEWLLKDRILNIPKNSELFLLRPRKDQTEPDAEMLRIADGSVERAWKLFGYMGLDAKREAYEATNKAVKDYGLDKKYRIIYIPPERWDAIRRKFFTKNPQGRAGRKRAESVREGSSLHEGKWKVTQRDLPQNIRSKMGVINKALAFTVKEMKPIGELFSKESFFGTRPAGKTGEEALKTAHNYQQKTLQWLELLREVNQYFHPHNVGHRDYYRDDADAWKKTAAEKWTTWRSCFDDTYPTVLADDLKKLTGGRSRKETIPNASNAGYGVNWAIDLLRDYGDKLKPVTGEELYSGENENAILTATARYMNALRGIVAEEYPPAGVAKALRALKQAVIDLVDHLKTWSPTEYQEKVGPFTVIYTRRGLDDPSSRISQNFVKRCRQATKSALEFIQKAKIKVKYYEGAVRFVDEMAWREEGGPQAKGGFYDPYTQDVWVNYYYDTDDMKSIRTMAAVLVHELAHRVMYRMPQAAWNTWEHFIAQLNVPLDKEAKGELEALLQSIQNKQAEPKDSVEFMQSVFPAYKPFLRSLLFYFKDHKTALEELLKKGTPQGLPTSYAGVSPSEAFPEIFLSLVYPYSGAYTIEKPHPFVEAEFRRMIEGIRESEEEKSVGTDSLTEAKMLLWHGTSSKFMKSILSVGFVPDPKKKTWEPGTGARESYSGTYFTNNFMTAVSSAGNTRRKMGGNNLYIAAQIETRTPEVVIDEDMMPNLGWVWGDYTQKKFHLLGPGEHYFTAIELWNGNLKIDWKELIQTYVDSIDVRGKREYIPRERWLHADAEIKEVLEAYLAYIMSQFVSREEEEENPEIKSRADDEKSYLSKWDIERYKNEAAKPWPEFKAARQRYRQAVDKVLRKLRDLAVQPKDSYMHNVRVTVPVDYRGANKILAVIEDFDIWMEFKRDGKETPLDLKGYDHVYRVVYSQDTKAIDDFIAQVLKHKGKYFKLEYLHGARGPKYDNREVEKVTADIADKAATMFATEGEKT